MKLLPKQEHAVFYLKDDTTSELVFGGAAGPGKSTLGVLWLIECAQKYPGTRWLMGRTKLKSLKETTLKTFFQQASRLGISTQFIYNEQSGVIKWHNGSEILLKDLFLYPSDPEFDSLGSLEITGAFVDECNQVTAKLWQLLKSRMRYRLKDFAPNGMLTKDLPVTKRNSVGEALEWRLPDGRLTTGLMPKLLGTCNPSKNWVYREFFKPWREKTLPAYRRFIQSLPDDNPYLPASYIEALDKLDKPSRERLRFGNWEYDDDPATIIHLDAITDYFNPTHIRPEGNKYMTIDVARKGKDKTVFRVWHGWLCIQRYVFDKNTIPEVVKKARELSRTHAIPLSNVVADEDGVGGGVVDYLGCAGFVNNSRPLNDENYRNLRSQCGIKMAQLIAEGGAGEVCHDSQVRERVAEEFEQIKLKDMDKDGKLDLIPKEEIIKNIGRSPDDWDTIAMRYWFALRKTFRTRIRV